MEKKGGVMEKGEAKKEGGEKRDEAKMMEKERGVGEGGE